MLKGYVMKIILSGIAHAEYNYRGEKTNDPDNPTEWRRTQRYSYYACPCERCTKR